MEHKGIPCHECAPKEFRKTPNITGSHELDAVIARSENPDVPRRLAMYGQVGSMHGSHHAGRVYRPQTGYNAYDGNSTVD